LRPARSPVAPNSTITLFSGVGAVRRVRHVVRLNRSRTTTTKEEHRAFRHRAGKESSPTTELPDEQSEPRKLSELQGDDPLILTLARGNFCPKEHQQHLELAANYPKINVAYTKIVTISTDTHHSSQEFRSSTGAQWPFLSDPERIVQKDLDIQEYTDPENDPMIPHTLVLKPGLVFHTVYNGYWFWGRPSFADLWRDLRDATREIRPTGTSPRRVCVRRGTPATSRRSHGWNRKLS